ncbi:MAG: PhzF family phenazine biosynthesis protein [Chloroflexi bacterium]|nr:PhzF family phenazine biosynthesis protein [Chloroflexota bacterium]
MTQFYIVDVFAERKYAGNQLAVFRDAADLSTELMQTIALEMGFSETTFILSDDERDGGYDVRIFTINEELPFAGHPTLGTAYIIRHEIQPTPADRVVLNLGVGPIPVTFRDDSVLWMQQKPPEFGPTHPADLLLPMLSLTADDLDTRFPIQTVSTGIPFIIVPIKSLEAMQRAALDPAGYRAVVEATGIQEVLFFAPETVDPANAINARMFFYAGEDPATGSANGCLAGYLVRQRFFGGAQIDLHVEQGLEIRRPSRLYLRAGAQAGGTIEVNVGGKVSLVARGEFV